MELLNKLHEIVEKKYKELQTYTETYNNSVEGSRKKLIEDNKEQFKKDPKSIDLKEIGKTLFFLNGFHQVDIRVLQTNFLTAYSLYKELGGDKKFEDEINTTAEFLKANIAKQMFVEKSGKFDEIVEGSVEQAMNNYDTQDYYKLFESQLLKLFNE